MTGSKKVRSSYKNMLTSLIDLMYYLKYIDPEMQKFRKEFLAKNGKKILFRPLSPKDDYKILEFYNDLGQETVYFRFFSRKKTVSLRLVRKYTRIDYEKQIAIVAVHDEKIIGVAHLISEKEGSAEMAVIVTDNWQHNGIGTALLESLVNIAREKDIRHLFGIILRDNKKILRTIDKFGFKVRKKYDHGDIEVEAYI